MPNLTDMQTAFVAAYTSDPACIANATASAKAAGYSAETARVQGQQLLAKPHVRAAIDAENRRLMDGEMVTLARHRVLELLRDPNLPPKIILDAAKTVLDRGGMPAQRPEDPSDPLRDKPLSDMTYEELVARAASAAAALDAQSDAETKNNLSSGDTKH